MPPAELPKPRIPVEEQIANFIRKKLDFSAKGVDPADVSVQKGPGQNTTLIVFSDTAIKKLVVGAADEFFDNKVKKFSTKMTAIFKGIVDGYEANPSPDSSSTTKISVEKSPADLAMEIGLASLKDHP